MCGVRGVKSSRSAGEGRGVVKISFGLRVLCWRWENRLKNCRTVFFGFALALGLLRLSKLSRSGPRKSTTVRCCLLACCALAYQSRVILYSVRRWPGRVGNDVRVDQFAAGVVRSSVELRRRS